MKITEQESSCSLVVNNDVPLSNSSLGRPSLDGATKRSALYLCNLFSDYFFHIETVDLSDRTFQLSETPDLTIKYREHNWDLKGKVHLPRDAIGHFEFIFI